MNDIEKGTSKVGESAGRLFEVEPMRRGSVSERYMKCGKPECACRKDSSARHGPYYSLTRGVGGKTQSRFLTATQAAIVKRQIEAGRRFRDQLEAYWKVCEERADEDLAEAEGEDAKKNDNSQRRSRRKQKRS